MSALWAVIAAAGRGLRSAQGGPKQFVELHGRRLLDWSVEALFAAVELEGGVIVFPEPYLAENSFSEDGLPGASWSENALSRNGPPGDRPASARVTMAGPRCRDIAYCAGGATRADSVAAGLNALDAAPRDWVLVHDAARPCVPREDIQRLVASVREAGVGGLLAQPLTDTLKRGDRAGRVQATLDRASLWRAQTPQMFRIDALRRALARALGDGVRVTDEAAAMERAGYPVQLIEGSAANLKVTYPEDFALAEFWLRRQGRIAAADQAPAAAGSKP